jgi:RNA polymerase sigma-70 factor (ECF subfamily)
MQDDQYYIGQVLKKGSEEALYRLVKRYEKAVFNLCFRVIRNREDAEEAAQDVFIKAFSQLNKLQDHGKFAGWLTRIAYHRAIDYARLDKKTPIELDEQGWEGIEDALAQTPHEQLANQDRKGMIELVLHKLPPLENALMTLYYMQGMSVKEVAGLTGLTESNVKVKLLRTRQVVKKLMKREFGTELNDLL